ncbi:MAG: Mur ligase family protein, partial [Paracoccus sp. (in: a-proteobacteria)]|nr:Mur ligase family protein [Paracoccus sp. (in: a-proteobacteria)]
NHWGVPLTLARMPADTDFAIIEIGMNHPGEIEPLARNARPHVAMITTVAAAHLEAFENIQGIAREKAAIFAGLEPMGSAVLPEDLDVTPILRDGADAAGAVVVGFGASGAARPVTVTPDGDGTQVRARILGETADFRLASLGAHFVTNAVGVLAALVQLGAGLTASARGLSDWRPYQGRGAVENLGDITLLDDSYNANPASLAAGLATLDRLPPGRRVAILGDMLELGKDEMAIHRDIATWPVVGGISLVHACGPRMKMMFDALPIEKQGIWAETADGLIARAQVLAAPGDVVFVKGSKSSRVASVVDALRKTWHSPAPDTKV